MRPRAAAFAALAVALTTTATHWLATAEWTQPAIEAPPGLSATGEVAAVEPTDAEVAGAPLLSVGRAVARLRIARDYTDRVRVAVAWTNVVEAAGLDLPGLRLDVGLYRPVSTARLGVCSTPGALALTDGGSTFCAVRDGGAVGSPDVVAGVLALAREKVTGYLLASVDGAAAAPCGADAGGPTAWCRPGAAYAADDERLLYVVALVTADGLDVVDDAVADQLEFAVRARLAG